MQPILNFLFNRPGTCPTDFPGSISDPRCVEIKGQGYTQDDPCIIKLADQSDCRDLKLQLVLERTKFSEGKKENLAGISCTPLFTETIKTNGKTLEKMIFEIKAFRWKDWQQLTKEFEGLSGYKNPVFDTATHKNKCSEKMIVRQSTCWFEVVQSSQA